MSAPKLFVSYSWSNPDHEKWVLDLAGELRGAGIDVLLDKWDLKEGHDANAYMEKMVSDPEIKKVILICDEVYAQKTDKRHGGVGTEAQIISSKIYERQDQDKFVAILKDRDADGKPYLPAYYSSRIFIDLSEPSIYTEEYEKLLRWVYDKPLLKKPELGSMPAFLDQSDSSVSLATSIYHQRAVNALRNGQENAVAIVDEYLSKLVNEFEKLRMRKDQREWDEIVLESIEQFIPYRNELIELFTILARSKDNEESRVVLHRFFENLIPFLFRPPEMMRHEDVEFDNYRFIIRELFQYAVTIFIKYGKFESAAHLMNVEYYNHSRTNETGTMEGIRVFDQTINSLAHRNQRLKLNRISLLADVLHDRCLSSGINIRDFIQADFLLFIRSTFDGQYSFWWPQTMIYWGRENSPFEIFLRASSLKYFSSVRKLFNVSTKEELYDPLAVHLDGNGQIRFGDGPFSGVNLKALMAFEKLGSKP